MREVGEQLWRAGKYAAAGSVVLGSLPFVIPSLFVLSVLLFTFVLPLLCAIAGFVYLQRHATMLYRYLPGTSRRSSGANVSRRSLPRSGGLTLLELLRKDSNSVDTFEEVDQEFDAVLVSTLPKFEKKMPRPSPRSNAADQVESRKEGSPVLQGDEARERTTSADNSSDSAEVQRKNADRDGWHKEAFASGTLRRGGRKEENDDGVEDEHDFRNAEEMSVLDDKHTKFAAAPGLSSEAGKSEQDSRKLQFVGTAPTSSGDYRGATEASCSELEKERSAGVGDVQGRKEEKSLSNDEERGSREPDLAAVNDYSMEDITSEDSRAVHPRVLNTERDVSGLSLVEPSGARRPESVPSDYGSPKVFRPDEFASDHESFESTSDASFEAPLSEKESDIQEEEDHHSLRSPSLRGTESSDGDDHSSVPDEDSYHYEVYAKAPERGDRSGEAPEVVLRGEESCSIVYGPEEGIFGYPSSSSREYDSLEEKAGTMKGSRSALAFSEDMYDSEDQLQLQQVHDEERHLRGELKAIKIVVGDDEGVEGPLLSEIAELNQILGIELPSMCDDIPELEWARVAVEVIKVVVGME